MNGNNACLILSSQEIKKQNFTLNTGRNALSTNLIKLWPNTLKNINPFFKKSKLSGSLSSKVPKTNEKSGREAYSSVYLGIVNDKIGMLSQKRKIPQGRPSNKDHSLSISQSSILEPLQFSMKKALPSVKKSDSSTSLSNDPRNLDPRINFHGPIIHKYSIPRGLKSIKIALPLNKSGPDSTSFPISTPRSGLNGWKLTKARPLINFQRNNS